MPRQLRIATFNLESLEVGRPGVLERRLAVLRPRLLRLDADLLCLQEVCAEARGRHAPRLPEALDALLAGTPYAAWHRVVSTNRAGTGPMDRHNLALVSRHPILESGQLWHDLVPPFRYAPVTAAPSPQEAPLQWDRPVQRAVIALPDGRRLYLFNLHLRAPRATVVPGQKDGGAWRSLSGWSEGFFMAAVKRSGQALETRLAVDRVFDREQEALVAVCGDLNADDREVPLRIIRGDEEQARFADRILSPVERSVPDDRRHSVIHRGRRIMLDHILASPALMAAFAAAEIHNEELGDEALAPADSPETFHAPLVAAFALG